MHLVEQSTLTNELLSGFSVDGDGKANMWN